MPFSHSQTDDQRMARALGLETTPAERRQSTQRAWQRFQRKRADQATKPQKKR